jgi:hypothetical protein
MLAQGIGGVRQQPRRGHSYEVMPREESAKQPHIFAFVMSAGAGAKRSPEEPGGAQPHAPGKENVKSSSKLARH